MATNTIIPITYDDVASAAQSLVDTGQKATTLAVRECLGRGSFTTVKKFLDRWQESQAEPISQPSPVPPQLESLWKEARRTAELSLATEREALQELSDELEARFTQLQSAAVDSDARRRVAETRLSDKDFEITRLCEVQHDLIVQRDHAQTQLQQQQAGILRERDTWLTRLNALEQTTVEQRSVIERLCESVRNTEQAVTDSSVTAQRELAEFRSDARLLITSNCGQLRAELQPLGQIRYAIDEITRLLRNLNRRVIVKRPRLFSDHPGARR